jgi:hypothetical protein
MQPWARGIPTGHGRRIKGWVGSAAHFWNLRVEQIQDFLQYNSSLKKKRDEKSDLTRHMPCRTMISWILNTNRTVPGLEMIGSHKAL